MPRKKVTDEISEEKIKVESAEEQAEAIAEMVRPEEAEVPEQAAEETQETAEGRTA